MAARPDPGPGPGRRGRCRRGARCHPRDHPPGPRGPGAPGPRPAGARRGDPVGPAASLFEKPYFQLIHDALAPGGHCCSQGENVWISLDFIDNLKKTAASIFPVAEYSYTCIPTYPSGQIGFIMGANAAGRDLKTPLRPVPNCIYYNGDIHKAAFVLPEFARAKFSENKDLLPVLGAQATGLKKKVLLLGSGFVAKPCAEYVVRNPDNELTIGE